MVVVMATTTPHTTGARLFVAVVPTPAAVADLRAAVRRAGLDGLRLTPVDQWHVTLAFLPSVPEALLPDVTRALDATAARHPSFDLGLGGAGRFGDRVVWVGLHGDTDALHRLATVVRDALVSVGAEPEDRPFRPHLTVARGSNGDRAAVRGAVQRLGEYGGPSWSVSAVRLIRSRPGEDGAQHETLVVSPLG
jgi:2'-5' RNA ligase